MTFDGRNIHSQSMLRCRACSSDLTKDGHWRDANGYRYCDKCVVELRLQQPHQVPLFKCDLCNRAWPLRALAERAGQLVCKECVVPIAASDGAKAAPAMEARFSASPMPSGHGAASGPRANDHAHPSRVEAGAIPAAILRGLPEGLVSNIACPHCWHVFAPDKVLWVSQHAELMGDPVLGPEAPSRFRPSRFNAAGEALDARDTPCQVLACPRCHLIVPRGLTETPPLFISIIGAPACGKSHFLASMVWELRRMMASRFDMIFNDADPTFNQILNHYEETLFLADRADRPVAIRKTEMHGDLYDQVRLGQQIITLPRPFLFTLRPMVPPGKNAETSKVRMMCFYDNAGEHYQPGMDSIAAPGTQHLARSRVLFFLYDPSQHPRFREHCRTVSSDPQLSSAMRSYRQEQILTEAAARVRRYTGLSSNKKHDRPLMVLVSKADIWASLLGEDLQTEPMSCQNGRWCVDLPRIERVSRLLRALLMKHSPEFVAAAEDFCQCVIYIPVSALGAGPEADENGGMLAIRPDRIRPQWVTAPVLYLLAKWSSGLVAALGKPAASDAAPAPSASVRAADAERFRRPRAAAGLEAVS